MRAFAHFLPALWLILLLPLPPRDAQAESAFARALRAADAGRWREVREIARKLPDPLMVAYLRWRQLRESEGEAGFEEIRSFLERHPDWPATATLRRRAEARMPESLSAREVDAYFRRFPPLTGTGALRWAAARDRLGLRRQARELVRRAWPRVRLSAREERGWRRRFGGWIDIELDRSRLDRLLWSRRHSEARRLLRRMPEGVRRLAAARIALQRSAPGVEAALARVPRSLLHDPGLLFDRLRWRMMHGNWEGAYAILLDPPAQLIHPRMWWELRRRAIARALARGRVRLAARLAAAHGQRSGARFAEAEWLAGWLALRTGAEKAALARFERLFAGVHTPVSRARAAYWAGRAAAALGREATARHWFAHARDHPTTFYGQQAAIELGGAPGFEHIPAFAVPAHDDDGPPADERLRLARLLCAAERAAEAAPFLRQLAAEARRSEQAGELLAELRGCGRPALYVEIVKRLAASGLVPRLLAYPLVEVPPVARDGVSPALLLALLRQESHFAHDAESPRGAVGISQFLPATARAVAREAGLPFGRQRLREDVGFQVRLAVHYLRTLLAEYRGDLLLALAAYNAGPGRVRQWMRQLGDPRRMDAHGRLDWLESLPFAETRNYVQRVLEARAVYRYLLRAGRVDIPRLALKARSFSEPLPRPKPERRS